MMSGWDVYENPNDVSNPNIGTVYFSGEDDGHQVKKGWVYTVPAQGIDAKAYNDDEEKYMYFNNSGDIVANQFKKINGKYYVFNERGIMKTGLVVWCASGRNGGSTYKYVNKLDLDWATGEEIAKTGRYNLGKNDDNQSQYIYVNTDGIVDHTVHFDNVTEGDSLKIHYFGEDGARKTGMNTVEFSDDSYTINTVGGSGDKGTGVFAKKYYSLGILLKASQDIRYGIYQTATTSMLRGQNGGEDWMGDTIDYYENLVGGKYLVLTTSGSKQKGNKTAKKDADGNYWMISQTDSSLRGIYTVGIKEDNNLSNFRTKTMSNNDNWGTGANQTFSTQQVAEKYPSLFVSDYQYEPINNSSVRWTKHLNESTNDCYFSCNYQGPCFQSDYADGTNKWIPFGMKDNALKSATFRYASGAVYSSTVVPASTDTASLGYNKEPQSNEYFLNCYWIEIKE